MRRAGATMLLALLLAGLPGCRGTGGVDGIEGAPVPSNPSDPSATASTGAVGPTVTAGATATTQPAPAPGATAPPVSQPQPVPLPPAATPGGLRLGGDDLGVTRVGAPFREAVAAVTAALGPPAGDPATDTACIGAEEEASWGSFRLANSGGRLSGWRSTGSLATPAGVTVGTTMIAVHLAYRTGVEVRPPAPDAATVFVVAGERLAGTATGPSGPDTVTALFNGTCESA